MYHILLNAAPFVGVVLTLTLALLPADSFISVALAMMQPDIGGLSGYGISYVRCLIPERNVLAILLLMYIPAVFLWRKVGRFAGRPDDEPPEEPHIELVESIIGMPDIMEGSTADSEEEDENAAFIPSLFPDVSDAPPTTTSPSTAGRPGEMKAEPPMMMMMKKKRCVQQQRQRRRWQTTQIMQTITGINLIKPYLVRMWSVEAWQWLWSGNVGCRHAAPARRRQPPPRKPSPPASEAGEQGHRHGEEWGTAKALRSFWDQLMTWIWWDQASGAYFCDTEKSSMEEKYQQVLRKYNKRLALYRKLPLRTASRLWGQINQVDLPTWLRPYAIRFYCWVFGCALEEVAIDDLTHYRNLSEFFRRKLKPGLRPISASQLTSPADGTVLHFGPLNKGALEQVKGVIYSLQGFLGPIKGIHPKYLTNKPMVINKSISASALEGMQGRQVPVTSSKTTSHTEREIKDAMSEEKFASELMMNAENELYQCIVYLSPADYHRFHSPADWSVFSRRHFPGELFSVNPGVARWLQGLYNFNERAVYSGRWQHGFFCMAAVGATNVGSIHVPFDKTLKTNDAKERKRNVFYDNTFSGKKGGGLPQKKGDEFGYFNLGSTMVMIFEAPPQFQFSIQAGQKVKYGQALGNYTKISKGCRK